MTYKRTSAATPNAGQCVAAVRICSMSLPVGVLIYTPNLTTEPKKGPVKTPCLFDGGQFVYLLLRLTTFRPLHGPLFNFPLSCCKPLPGPPFNFPLSCPFDSSFFRSTLNPKQASKEAPGSRFWWTPLLLRACCLVNASQKTYLLK